MARDIPSKGTPEKPCDCGTGHATLTRKERETISRVESHLARERIALAFERLGNTVLAGLIRTGEIERLTLE